MRREDWHGLVAAILALGVSVGVCVPVIVAALHDDPLTTQGAALLNTATGAIIGALATWLGRSLHDRRRHDDDDE